MDAVLAIKNLSVCAVKDENEIEILHDISFSVNAGEMFALVGESGSGKTTLACSLTKLFPPNEAMVLRGSVQFAGKDLLTLSSIELRKLLRSEIRYLFQEPGLALDPLSRIEKQVRASFDQTDDALTRRTWLFRTLGLESTASWKHFFPHQVSVGTLQRILFGMALAPGPKLVIADEPTSAVDSALKIQIMEALKTMKERNNLGLLLITHDIPLAMKYADRIAVIFEGRIVEMNAGKEFFAHPAHPYSKLLMESALGGRGLMEQTVSLPKSSGAVLHPENRCRFQSRCAFVQPDCLDGEPPFQPMPMNGTVRCLHWK